MSDSLLNILDMLHLIQRAQSKWLALFLFLFAILYCQAKAQPSFVYYFCINENGNYTANSTYQTNLNTVLSTLVSKAETGYGFYNFSYGQKADKVNTIGMCRGDVKPDECHNCLVDSRFLLPQRCPNQKEAIGWYDKCFLRYSNRSIFGILEPSPSFYSWNTNNVTEVDQFNQVLRVLLEDLRSRAASGDSVKKFAAGSKEGPNYQKIYALVQCTPDLSEQQCSDCLVGAISEIPDCCSGRTLGWVMRPSCILMFSTSTFFDPSAVAPPPSSVQVSSLPPSYTNSTKEGKRKSNRSRTVMAVVTSIVTIVVLLVFICVYFRQRKPRKDFETFGEAEVDKTMEPTDSLQFDFHTIRIATDNFSDANKLGKGGFGPVYKGRLANGQEVAIKRLSRNSEQGDNEFKTEVSLMTKLQQRNLVRLHGFCLYKRERILLYEFLPNKSLDYFIFDQVKRLQLNWERRYKIIKGIARGIFYLHEDSQLRIVHRDLKLSNILLDIEINPKISDFGMARIFAIDQTQGNTFKIAGTFGYMAPEYTMHEKFSIKSDIFSFGVLILEIISGKKNNGNPNEEKVEHLLSLAWDQWRKGRASEIIDSTLQNDSRTEIMRCIQIALRCVQENAADRPTLASILLMLEDSYITIPVPLQPAFFMKMTTLTSINSVDALPGGSVEASRNEISITEPYPAR